MPLINWSSALSVNIKEIDSQHQQLVEMINQLHDAMRAGKGHLELLPTLEGLVNYTETHFAAEEAMMRRINYPEFTRHKALHDSFTRQVRDIQSKARVSQVGLSVQVSNFLKDWLTQHIQKEDNQYKSLANQKGIL